MPVLYSLTEYKRPKAGQYRVLGQEYANGYGFLFFMLKNRPLCPVCAGEMKKNGTTSKGTTRWRCKSPHCGASTIKQRHDLVHAAAFRTFHAHATGTLSLSQAASAQGCSRWTLQRRFTTFWLIDVPNTPDPNRIHDQIFIDGTYTSAGCLLIASTIDNVLCWHWATSETTKAYTALLSQLAPPLCVVLDGGQGALSTIKKLWPNTKIQRCLIHAQRVVRRHVTTRPRTQAGKAILALARGLTHVHTLEQAAQWAATLHQFGQVYRTFLNKKTILPPERNPTGTKTEYTHQSVRRAYFSLRNLYRKNWLFSYLTPPDNALEPHRWAATTNSLEGGINSQLKFIARAHRGRGGEHQRKMLEWWLHAKTPLPDDPIEIARQHNWGKDQLAKVHILTHNENQANHETGRPALYDNAIPNEYNHNLGIRKGWPGT